MSAHIIVADDHAGDRYLLVDAARQAVPHAHVSEVISPDDLDRALGRGPADVIVADYWLSGWTGVDAIARVRTHSPGCEAVLVTGSGSERTAAEAIGVGARHYLNKGLDQLRRLPVLLRALVEEQAARRAATDLDRLKTIAMGSVTSAVVIADPKGTVLWVNAAAERLTGHALSDVKGHNLREFRSDVHREAFYEQVWSAMRAGLTWSGRAVLSRRDGTTFVARATATPVVTDGGSLAHLIVTLEDVSDFEHLERQYRHAQKMEAVGRLAAGVAHDFNNLLTVIRGFCEIAEEGMAPDDPRREALDEVDQAGRKATALTRQLLAFSRRSEALPECADLGAVLTGLRSMLRRLLPEAIVLEVVPAARPAVVYVDVGQLQQAVLNLAVNAADAMPDGGTLRIEARAGDAHAVVVSDTGSGIAPEARQRIFEPFFTTKDVGKGTGLGLSMVHDFVAQSGGWIDVESEPGKGTTFTLRLPSADPAPCAPSSVAAREAAASLAGRSVLVVEDEPAVGRMAGRAIEAHDGDAVVCRSAAAALAVAATTAPFDLAVVDVILSDMAGTALAARLRESGAAARTLFISGYTDAPDRVADAEAARGALLAKPFTAEDLARAIRARLNDP